MVNIKTERLFTGDIYCSNYIVESNAVLVYIPNKGYIKLDDIRNEMDILLTNLGINDHLVMGLEKSGIIPYVKRETIRPFEHDYVSAISNVSVKHLKLVQDDYRNQKR